MSTRVRDGVSDHVAAKREGIVHIKRFICKRANGNSFELFNRWLKWVKQLNQGANEIFLLAGLKIIS